MSFWEVCVGEDCDLADYAAFLERNGNPQWEVLL